MNAADDKRLLEFAERTATNTSKILMELAQITVHLQQIAQMLSKLQAPAEKPQQRQPFS